MKKYHKLSAIDNKKNLVITIKNIKPYILYILRKSANFLSDFKESFLSINL